ncbi:glycoside hydrolase family 55 protein [Xylariaceae sp. FL0255]|nr:glycoside hydrolase family 55 protein [Xylariaceae sp. FL0255]
MARTVGIISLLVLLFSLQIGWARQWNKPESARSPNAPYMIDNQHDYFKAAPDKGSQNGPIWPYSGTFENYMANLQSGYIIRGGNTTSPVPGGNNTLISSTRALKLHLSTENVQGDTYWLPQLTPLGIQPLAEPGYQFFRNVVDDYGADNTGTFDTTEAINAAILNGNRCGEECGSSFTQGAIVYFPPGTYLICTPIIQYYYTQFIGDALDPPTIKGCSNFSGIALIDTDPYIPGGAGAQWYVNQNQFFRHIRNLIFDMQDMPLSTDDTGQPYVPTGIHWQAAQATTLQNLVFKMPLAGDNNTPTHVGIFTENGSGGFVSELDLVFYGGAIGYRAGSQHYTARNLTFNGCLTAVQMIWAWGWNWQGIVIDGSTIGFNISGRGGDNGQGIGSISLIDCTISNVPTAILTKQQNPTPNIILDNLYISNVTQVVQQDGAETLLNGTTESETVALWGVGLRYNGSIGSYQTGDLTSPPSKADGLLADNRLFVRSRPQYEDVPPTGFLVATQNNVSNDGTGDQADAISAFLLLARANSQIAYFPAGIYQVGSAVYVPTGSRVQGSSWSQIQGAGLYFSDMSNPQVMVQVGNKGDVGSVEIVEMLFTVKGSLAGAVLMEWNVQAESQGSAGLLAAMWDSHFRVGGGNGTDLDFSTCPKLSFSEQCIASSLMLHVTQQASGYFENLWAWIADRDNDFSTYNSTDKLINQISVYGARGVLIESQGPSWFYGLSSEHSVLYNVGLSNAKNVYIGHVQTESPYYQPDPVAPMPFTFSKSFTNDPSFSDCLTDSCKASWGLRIVGSSNITIHGKPLSYLNRAGLYSFYQDYNEDCLATADCQERILEVTGSTGVAIYNLFTVATSQVANGVNDSVVYGNDTQSGFTSEVSLWLPLSGQDNIEVVSVGTEVWSNPTIGCSPPCILILPTSTLSGPTTIIPGNFTTSLEYGTIDYTTFSNGQVMGSFSAKTTTITINIPAVTTNALPFSNYNITGTQTGGAFVPSPSVSLPPIGVPLPDGLTGTTTRTVYLPPWPAVTSGPVNSWEIAPDSLSIPINTPSSAPPSASFDIPPSVSSSVSSSVSFGVIPSTTSAETYYLPYITTITNSAPTITTLQIPSIIGATTVPCPPYSQITFNQPRTTSDLSCPVPTEFTFQYTCPTLKTITLLGATSADVQIDCSLFNVIPSPPTFTTSSSSTSSSTTFTLPVWATWPPGEIVPVTTTVNQPEPTDDGVKVPCHLWFFFRPSANDYQVANPIYYQRSLASMAWYHEPTTSCQTQTASICSTTSFVTESITGSTTTTETSISTGQCEVIEGCSATDSTTATATTTTVACTPTASGDYLNVCMNDALIFPQDPSNVDGILSMISAYSGKYQQVQGGGVTAFIWCPSLDTDTFNQLKSSTSIVSDVQYYEQMNEAILGDYSDDDDDDVEVGPSMLSKLLKADDRHAKHKAQQGDDTYQHQMDNITRFRRTAALASTSRYWHLAPNSLAKHQIFFSYSSASYIDDPSNLEPFQYWYDDVGGYDSELNQGYSVFVSTLRQAMINEDWVDTTHPEWTAPGAQGTLELIQGWTFNDPNFDPLEGNNHGSSVAAMINGYKIGTCKRCHVLWLQVNDWERYKSNRIECEFLAHLYKSYDYILQRGLQGKAVINMSFKINELLITEAGLRSTKYILDKLDAAGAVIVTTAGNDAETEGRTISGFPAQFASPDLNVNPYGQIKNLIVVGATDYLGTEAPFSQSADYLTTYSSGQNIWVPEDPNTFQDPWVLANGTSLAAGAVSGIAAYLRSLDSPFKEALQDPANVKIMIAFLAHRYLTLQQGGSDIINVDLADLRPVAWNGQVTINSSGVITSHSCLSDYDTISSWDTINACSGLNPNMFEMGPGEDTGSCGADDQVAARDDGGTCPSLSVTNGAPTITFASMSTPSPTCTEATGCGGTICTGFYCTPNPTGVPPDYMDPQDPNNGQPVQTTVIGTWWTAPTTTTTFTSPTTSTSSAPASTSSSDNWYFLDHGYPFAPTVIVILLLVIAKLGILYVAKLAHVHGRGRVAAAVVGLLVGIHVIESGASKRPTSQRQTSSRICQIPSFIVIKIKIPTDMLL